MSLILMIIQIIGAIPTIISIIGQIMKLIHQLKGQEKSAAESQLKGILARHLKGKDHKACQSELEQFHSDLKGKYGDAAAGH